MMATLVVRYRAKRECVEENASLIGDVFAELAQTQPGGLSCGAYRLADSVTFLVVEALSGCENALTTSSAFVAS